MASAPAAVLLIEHPVPDFEAWKRDAFDRDPVGRERNGVRRYRILRSGGRPDLVAIELEFDSRAAAESFASALTDLWRGVRERFGWKELPAARIFEIAASAEY